MDVPPAIQSLGRIAVEFSPSGSLDELVLLGGGQNRRLELRQRQPNSEVTKGTVSDEMDSSL